MIIPHYVTVLPVSELFKEDEVEIDEAELAHADAERDMEEDLPEYEETKFEVEE